MRHIIKTCHDACKEVVEVGTVFGRSVSLDHHFETEWNGYWKQDTLTRQFPVYLFTKRYPAGSIIILFPWAKASPQETRRYRALVYRLTDMSVLSLGLAQSQTVT